MTETDRIRKFIRTMPGDISSTIVRVEAKTTKRMAINVVAEMFKTGEIEKSGKFGSNKVIMYRLAKTTKQVKDQTVYNARRSFIYGGNAQRMADNLHYEGIA